LERNIHRQSARLLEKRQVIDLSKPYVHAWRWTDLIITDGFGLQSMMMILQYRGCGWPTTDVISHTLTSPSQKVSKISSQRWKTHLLWRWVLASYSWLATDPFIKLILKEDPKTELTEKQIYAHWTWVNEISWQLDDNQVKSASKSSRSTITRKSRPYLSHQKMVGMQ
jgi:hypothetical protein